MIVYITSEYDQNNPLLFRNPTVNDDFQCSSNPFQLTFPDGSSSASGSSMSITITILSDDIIEDAEDFQLSLTAVSSAAAIASGQGSSTVTITDQTGRYYLFQLG